MRGSAPTLAKWELIHLVKVLFCTASCSSANQSADNDTVNHVAISDTETIKTRERQSRHHHHGRVSASPGAHYLLQENAGNGPQGPLMIP
ncbi:unnamed protein product [Lota lota]